MHKTLQSTKPLLIRNTSSSVELNDKTQLFGSRMLPWCANPNQQHEKVWNKQSNKQHCKIAMCWSRGKPQMCGNPKPSALCWTTKGTPPLRANPNHQHETCWALCHLTSSIWMELLTINIHEVQCPKIFLHESFGHVHIICGVQTRLGNSFAYSHICFLHHCIPSSWIQKHGLFSKVVQVVDFGWSVPYIQTFAVWIICNQWPHVMDPCYSLSKVSCWLYW